MPADEVQRRAEDDWRIERAAERASELAADKAVNRFGQLIGINPSVGADVDRFRANMGWIDERRQRERQAGDAIRRGLIEKVLTGLGLILVAGLMGVLGTIATKGHL